VGCKSLYRRAAEFAPVQRAATGLDIASRMQSHGVPGNIQITRQVYEQIKDQYVCRPRGKIMIKDKGDMET
jgi:class 3 adenylate cyclase